MAAGMSAGTLKRWGRITCCRQRLLLAAALAAVVPGAHAFQAAKSTSPLKIVDVLFEDYEGFTMPRLEARAGRDVVLIFRVEGFERREGKAESGLPEYRVSLQHEVELRDPDGVLVAPAESGKLETLLGVQDDKWQPLIRWTAALPPWSPSGNYAVRIGVFDEIGDQRAEASVAVRVRGEAVQPSDTLAVRQAEFARTDEGPWSPQRYFALREPVHVRYKVVGFRVSPEKRIWVEQDWAVLNAEGQVVLAQENAVAEESENFYPARFLATSFHLEFDDPKPGAYTLRIGLRDRVGDQTASFDFPFTLRP
jgi:hypothetical protein